MESRAARTQPTPDQARVPATPGFASPRPLRWLVPIIFIYVILLVALPVQMVVQNDALAETIKRDQTDLDAAQLELAVGASIIYSAVLHAVVAGLVIWFTIKVLRGRQWARIALTVCLLIAAAGSLISATVGGMYLYYVIASNAAHLAVLTLLWLPPSVRRFFAEQRASSVARRSS